jgi:hypothetical protein
MLAVLPGDRSHFELRAVNLTTGQERKNHSVVNSPDCRHANSQSAILDKGLAGWPAKM